MNMRSQLVCVWIGLASLIIFGLSFWPFARFIPLLPPTLTAAEVADIFQNNPNGIRFGMMLMMFAGSLYCVLVAVIAVQLKRIEKVNQIWTYTQIISGAVSAMIIIMGAMLMTAAVFRPDRSPELNYLLYDLAWLFIVMPGTPFIIQFLSIGFAIFSDKSTAPVFPRWVGYLNCWVALLFLPSALVSFFKLGPFAWDGILAFYVPAVAFGLWYVVMLVMLRKAIKQQA